PRPWSTRPCSEPAQTRQTILHPTLTSSISSHGREKERLRWVNPCRRSGYRVREPIEQPDPSRDADRVWVLDVRWRRVKGQRKTYLSRPRWPSMMDLPPRA